MKKTVKRIRKWLSERSELVQRCVVMSLIWFIIIDVGIIEVGGRWIRVGAYQINAFGRLLLHIISVIGTYFAVPALADYLAVDANEVIETEDAPNGNESDSREKPTDDKEEMEGKPDEESDEKTSEDEERTEKTVAEMLEWIYEENRKKIEKDPTSLQNVAHPKELMELLYGSEGNINNVSFREKKQREWMNKLEEVRNRRKQQEQGEKSTFKAVAVVITTVLTGLMTILKGNIAICLIPTYVLTGLTVLKRGLDISKSQNGNEVINSLLAHEYGFLKFMWLLQGAILTVSVSKEVIFRIFLIAFHGLLWAMCADNCTYDPSINVVNKGNTYLRIYPMIRGIIPDITKEINIKKIGENLMMEERTKFIRSSSNMTDLSRIVNRNVDMESTILMSFLHIYSLNMEIKEDGHETRKLKIFVDSETQAKDLVETLSTLVAARAAEVITPVTPS